MVNKHIVAVAALSLALVGQAQAQSEGAGDPFPFRAPAQVVQAGPFVADIGSQAFPTLTGQSVLLPGTARMTASAGSEAPVETVNSLPRGFQEGTVAFVQQQSLDRWLSARQTRQRLVQSATPGFD